MNSNFKLYFKYILFNVNFVFLKYLIKDDKNTNIVITQQYLYYLTLHLKLSSLFYSVQLSDMFVYEIPFNKNETLIPDMKYLNNSNNNLIVYNFHSIYYQQRFFIFVISSAPNYLSKYSFNKLPLTSITELFLNANWLERENAELNGVFFLGKKDLRNLMLPYGDTSAPMQKSFPSIGTREIFYDTVTDLLIQNPVSIQF